MGFFVLYFWRATFFCVMMSKMFDATQKYLPKSNSFVQLHRVPRGFHGTLRDSSWWLPKAMQLRPAQVICQHLLVKLRLPTSNNTFEKLPWFTSCIYQGRIWKRLSISLCGPGLRQNGSELQRWGLEDQPSWSFWCSFDFLFSVGKVLEFRMIMAVWTLRREQSKSKCRALLSFVHWPPVSSALAVLFHMAGAVRKPRLWSQRQEMLYTLRVSGPLRNTLRNTKGETGGSLIFFEFFSMPRDCS